MVRFAISLERHTEESDHDDDVDDDEVGEAEEMAGAPLEHAITIISAAAAAAEISCS